MTLGGPGNAERRLVKVARDMPWHQRLIAALILAIALIALLDVLASAVSRAVENNDSSWPWGLREASSGSPPATAPPGLRLASVHLVIAVSGDDLTASYTVTSSSGPALATQAQAAESAGSGDQMVSDLLGRISVAQFKNGFTPGQYESTTLEFMTPQVVVNGGATTVTIDSSPYRLLLGQQYIDVAPASVAAGPPGDVQFTYPSGLALLHPAGASLISVSPADPKTGVASTDLRRGNAVVTATLYEAGTNWTTGLRSVGGMNLPLGGAMLQRLASLVTYLALLWSLTRICGKLSPLRSDVRSVAAASTNAVSVIVGALIALSVLSFAYQLMFEMTSNNLVGPLLAGPTALSVAGTLVLWPVLCWRVTATGGQSAGENQDAAQDQSAGANQGSGKRSWPGQAPLLLVAVAYLVLLNFWPGRSNQVTWWPIALALPATVIVVYLLGILLLGRGNLTPRVRSVVLASLLAVVLAATLGWPVLVFTGFYEGKTLDVNLIGKWIYLAAAIVAVSGLCVLTARVIRVLAASHIEHLEPLPDRPGRRRVPRTLEQRRRMWGWTWLLGGAAVLAVMLAATIPSLIHQSQVRDPHAEGLVPNFLTSYVSAANLFRALPQLLNWLFLALAIAVLLSISRAARAQAAAPIAPPLPGAEEAEARHVTTDHYQLAARRLAIPVMMLILFSAYSFFYHPWIVSDYTWLYLPVTQLLGLLILTWVLPAGQATAPQTLEPGRAIRLTLRAWRNADFADSQRQQLMGNADDLRKEVLGTGSPDAGDQAFFRLAGAQSRLAERRDNWQRSARAHLREAFDHHGEPPDPAAGRRGALVGVLVGLAPAVMLFLKTRPALGWSGYPVLDFLGFTAWLVLIWPALGWAMGYFLPFIRGRNGINKALCVYIAVGASLPMNLLWLDGSEWKITAIYYLAGFAFLLIIGVVLSDLMALVSAGLSPLAWVQVHNWRFLVTYSTAVIAAIGTATAAFLSTAATDLGQQTVTSVTGQSATGSTPVHG
jgi:hypothetical protein